MHGDAPRTRRDGRGRQEMEKKAWGAFRYEVFPAYDLVPIAAQLKQDHA